ncbi:fasciclin domain-containing protein [Christiangramia crocea]|uniref:Fasciclin domain-containing protein n=1 Tax=Christiangramia crocea TaxID=2904124 RepID=A0A9X2A4S0_9FLAO|nr:fasciclin domain-containing protein [Gramella crocea]MCG9970844.1 fasciclin domain-containing protein [Gramella crocea]
MKIKILFILFAISAMVFTSCEDNKKKEQEDNERMEQMEAEREAEMNAEIERMDMESNSIAAKAMETDTLSTLVSALQTAEMADLLTVSEGPYTVFAPNNAAFEKVDKATLDNLMKEENQEDLSNFLEYHVVEDEITSQELVEMVNDNEGEYTITTLEGGELRFTLEGESLIITDEAGNKAKIVQADVDASNGIVHIIDAVVMKKA